ncbi:hypothetical protein OIDMADRAFT_176696 [Oidiodendron maius Zn]|uniref:Uncharacterized protein n=1 Tax=Oidiodendron maius (strain Zn) TaxID=913774 RepID=A0A0C3HUI4_OIDMZ|nr:hypothetical protein OIDMADRAFT_176696 [Oidiodendron maius Zn]
MTSNSNSHKEIWDDSLLVDSWNEALEEYKYYHSIHTRGEKVEDVLLEAEKQGETESVHRPTNEEGGLKPSSVEHVDLEAAKVYDQPVDDHHAKNDRPPHLASHQTSSGSPEKVPALPQHLIGQVHDESLKNLLMSWYYAGYYTGLYEGQQQGAASRQA